ncbi:hypothetical protein ACHAQA_005306 [Verticillium albo-atrum]
MTDRLTQLQDAVDQLAQQFVASFHYVNRHHSLETLGPKDKVREVVKEASQLEVEAADPEEFRAGLLELSRDLILKEQQIEVLISTLPGLDTSEADQQKNVRELEEELKVAEAQRQEAIKEKDQILVKLDEVIRNVRRP